jgi:hypothetical protein
MEKCILILLIIFILYYTFTKVFGKSNSKFNLEHFTDFKKDFTILSNVSSKCIDKNTQFHKYDEDIHRYIPVTTKDKIDNSYMLLTTPSLYRNNNDLIQSYEPYIHYIKQTMDINNIIEQLQYNVYKFKGMNKTDLIGIIPEYHIEDIFHIEKNKRDEDYNMIKEEDSDNMITHDINMKSGLNNDIFKYIRFIGGVSYTYYFFIIPIGSKIYSMNDFKNYSVGVKTIYIIYDDKMIQNKSLKGTKRHIEAALTIEYSNDSSLQFIKEYVKFVSGSNIVFAPLSISDIDSKFNSDNVSNNVILGNNNYSVDIMNKFNFMEATPKYQIFGFDGHDNTLFDNNKSTDIGNYESRTKKHSYKRNQHLLEEEEDDTINERIYSKMDEYSKYYEIEEEGGKEEFYYDNYLKDQKIIGRDFKMYLEKKTKQLLDFYKLQNTLIQNVHVNDIIIKNHVDCDNYGDIDIHNNKEKIKRDIEITNAQKSGYDYCRTARGTNHKQHYNKNIYFPIKTFLFRNIAITHKYTNDKYIYNFLHIFMKNLNIENKLSLMSLNTNIDIHKGAHLFYKNYGFISNINNVDCVYNIGKKKCKKNSRNRVASIPFKI